MLIILAKFKELSGGIGMFQNLPTANVHVPNANGI